MLSELNYIQAPALLLTELTRQRGDEGAETITDIGATDWIGQFTAGLLSDDIHLVIPDTSELKAAELKAILGLAEDSSADVYLTIGNTKKAVKAVTDKNPNIQDYTKDLKTSQGINNIAESLNLKISQKDAKTMAQNYTADEISKALYAARINKDENNILSYLPAKESMFYIIMDDLLSRNRNRVQNTLESFDRQNIDPFAITGFLSKQIRLMSAISLGATKSELVELGMSEKAYYALNKKNPRWNNSTVNKLFIATAKADISMKSNSRDKGRTEMLLLCDNILDIIK